MLYLIKIPDNADDNASIVFLVQEAIDQIMKNTHNLAGLTDLTIRKQVFMITTRQSLENALFHYQSPSLLTHEKTVFILKITQKAYQSLKVQEKLDRLKLKNIKIISVYPIGLKKFPFWLDTYFKKNGVTLDLDTRQLLCSYCEGNLLATQQCLEKLKLFYPAGHVLTVPELLDVLTPAAKYNLFDFIDSLTPEKTYKIPVILNHLAESGIEPAMILWGLSRECRRKKMSTILPTLIRADRIIKGIESGYVWDNLLSVAFSIAGQSLFQPSS